MFNEHTKHTLESVQKCTNCVKYHINSLKYTIITQSDPFYIQGFFNHKKI